MFRRSSTTFEFEGKPTIGNLIAALTELREEQGESAQVGEVRGQSRFSRNGGGSFTTAITVVFAQGVTETTAQ